MIAAEELREAAALIRERAEAATGATYHWRSSDKVKAGRGLVACGAVQIALTDETLGGGHANADHIASWHPAVALAVADWLDTAARLFEHGDPGGPLLQGHALAVARTYIGGGQ